jgi:WD40 repeat protein
MIWDVRSHRLLSRPMELTEGVAAADLSPDFRLLARPADGNQSVRLWDALTGRAVTELPALPFSISGLRFSPDGRLLGVVDDHGSVQLWDVRNGRQLGGLANIAVGGQSGIGGTLEISPDDRLLAVGDPGSGDGGAVLLWDIEARRKVGELQTADPSGRLFQQLLFSHDSSQLYAITQHNGDPGVSIVWDLNPASWRRDACAIAGRNLGRAEWDMFIGSQRSYERTCPAYPPGLGAPR